MFELLTQPGIIPAVITAIIAPIINNQVRKTGEKSKEQIQGISDKIDKQSDKVDEIDKRLKIQDKAMLGTIRYELMKAMSTAIKRKYTTTKEIEDIHDLLEPYKEMGGNGTVDTMYKKFRKLEIDDSKGEIL